MTITQFTAARAAASSCHSSADFLGLFQDIAPWELEDVWSIHDNYSIATVRALSGLTQKEFATRYGISLTTVQAWTLSPRSANRRNIQPYLLDLLAVDIINNRAAEKNPKKLLQNPLT